MKFLTLSLWCEWCFQLIPDDEQKIILSPKQDNTQTLNVEDETKGEGLATIKLEEYIFISLNSIAK